jgi:ribonuclease P protein component
MLPQNRRINKGFLKEILVQGRSFYIDGMAVRVYKNPVLGAKSAFTVVVSGKTVKTAVARNLLKRRVRYIIQKYLSSIAEGYFFMFNFKKDFSKLKFSDLEEKTMSLLKQTRLVYN